MQSETGGKVPEFPPFFGLAIAFFMHRSIAFGGEGPAQAFACETFPESLKAVL